MKQTIKGYPMMIGYLGYFMMMMGIIILLPLLIMIPYPEEITLAFAWILPGVLCLIFGYLLTLILHGKTPLKLERHQDAILLLLIWIIAIFVSSIPLILLGHYTFTQSLFESTSGYSTTGLTIVDVATASKTLLFYRSLMQFFGGVGLVLVLTSTLSDRYGMRLYHAEGHNDKLLPNLAKSARLILSLYTLYIVLGMISYILCGMSWFDAINHATASLSTGGFSSQPDSIGYYKSSAIEWITIILMILGSTNFFIHMFILKGKFKMAFNHIEVKFFLITTPIIVTMMWFALWRISYPNPLRIAIFQYVSAITTTGFQTVPTFQQLPPLFTFGVIIMMIIGGQAGSTSGGIKQYRIGMMLKNIYWNIRDRMTHQRTIHAYDITKFGKNVHVQDADLHATHAFIMLYVLTLVVGTLIFNGYGYSLQDSLFEFSSSLGTVGLSIGIISPVTPNGLLWTSMMGMFLGRLEFYVVIIAISSLITQMRYKRV